MDKIQQAIDRYLDRDPGDEPDEIDDVLAEYTSQHPSERLARQQRKTTPTRVGRRRRATGLTILSGDALFSEAASQLADDERLVLGDDGHSIEVLEGVEFDEEVEGEINVVLRD